MSHLITLLLTC